MNGNLMVVAIVTTAFAAGVGLWYSQTYAYYEQRNDLDEVSTNGEALPVSNYLGIDANTSPLKLRACFTVDWDYFPSEEFKEVAEPLTAPFWFDCFDAKMIAKDIKAGNSTVILAEKNQPFGFSRFITHYPDGRAYMWRQINACGKAQFDGNDLPEGCEQEVSATHTPDVVQVSEFVFSMTPLDGRVSEAIMRNKVNNIVSNVLSAGLMFLDPENPVSVLKKNAIVASLNEHNTETNMVSNSLLFQGVHAIAWRKTQASKDG
jgi:hypothetical protein